MKSIHYIFIVLILFGILQLSIKGKQGNPHGDIKIDCIECHSPENWQFKGPLSSFDHNTTGYPLIVAHKETDCRACHENLVFNFIGISCVDCHTDIHKNELGIHCEDCHTPQNWENRQEILKQHNLTRFPLIGVHSVLDCEACHVNQQRNEYKNTPVDCEYCHYENYQSATNPNHQLAKFQLNCLECHHALPSTWKKVNWQHPQIFTLNGAHQFAECIDCHAETYQGTANDCFSCHESDYLSAIFPNHSQEGYPVDCSLCHNEQQWQGALFDHLQQTGYELIGKHSTLFCADCHIDNQTIGLPTDCIGCHESDFNSVQTPNHLLGQYPFDCLICHNQISWVPAIFDHNQTQFPLTGGHQNIACFDCHTDGQYTQLPTDCWSCHETDYNDVSDPDHIANNFDHDCTICHTTQAWQPANFDHSNTQFPLTGAHLTIDCIDCHSQGYTNTPTDCWSCHQTDYNNSTNPNHQAAGFPTNCELCHNTINWNQTTWDHDAQYFPIYSGKHRNEWNTCDECHVNPNNYTVFECIFCHEHANQAEVDEDHNGVSGYVYASWACYDCHPDGDSKRNFKIELKKSHN